MDRFERTNLVLQTPVSENIRVFVILQPQPYLLRFFVRKVFACKTVNPPKSV